MEGKNDIEVFDASGKVLGRLASTVAKRLMHGNEVVIANASKAIISGDRKVIAARYKTRLDLLEKENPEHSPYWSRRPDMLVKRIVRGMLPYRLPKGKAAYRRLKVYIDAAPELKNAKRVDMESKNPRTIYAGHVTVGELSRMLGYDRK
ncbi:MAG: 50S ribosomal protein L13 [Candidatus Micrarchaeota archaeon]|nr:50S ribosomal protein L13 [Candidatus Micrarchaeota archaeon]